jgi:hypothetical protein
MMIDLRLKGACMLISGLKVLPLVVCRGVPNELGVEAFVSERRRDEGPKNKSSGLEVINKSQAAQETICTAGETLDC